MTGWKNIDFGANVPGEASVVATGTNQATAYQIIRKHTVFGTVANGTAGVLPSAYSSGTEITIFNRGANVLLIFPGTGDQIEAYGVNQAVAVAPGGDATFVSFDPPLTTPPRTWWLK